MISPDTMPGKWAIMKYL